MQQQPTSSTWRACLWAGIGVVAGGTLALLIAARGSSTNTPAFDAPGQDATKQRASASDRKGRRCVAMSFLDSNLSRHTFAGDSAQLAIRGDVPCAAEVIAWSMVGPIRLWDDGLVEYLVIPVPPCPQGNGSVFYAWLGFPNPNAN
jgi:hypothetical protein